MSRSQSRSSDEEKMDIDANVDDIKIKGQAAASKVRDLVLLRSMH